MGTTKITREQIKRASEIAEKDYHIPLTWSKETWESSMGQSNRAIKEFVPNAERNKVSILEAIKKAEKEKK